MGVLESKENDPNALQADVRHAMLARPADDGVVFGTDNGPTEQRVWAEGEETEEASDNGDEDTEEEAIALETSDDCGSHKNDVTLDERDIDSAEACAAGWTC